MGCVEELETRAHASAAHSWASALRKGKYYHKLAIQSTSKIGTYTPHSQSPEITPEPTRRLDLLELFLPLLWRNIKENISKKKKHSPASV